MGRQQHVIDEPAAPWVVRPVTDPKRDAPRDAIDKYLSDGLDGRPHALLVKFPALWKNPAHFHDQPQFQIVLDGNLTISNHTVEAVAVHYTDANVAYGPLLMGPHLTFGLFRLQKAREFKMSEPDSRVLRDPHGRELSGQSKDVAWIKLPGKREGIEQKMLIGKASEAGPKAHMLKCAPGVELQFDPAPSGEFHILLEGSALIDNQEVKPNWLRQVIGAEAPSPITAGRGGASWLVLTFDQTAVAKA